uniref:Ycf37 n=1 Tax=Gelidium vagum TaxID=35171 RepID=A0A141SE52_GELVA|nr:hypothetical protein Gvag_119 [Gelidium vagum]AMK96570.1 hypothetical protein Gvag_119 [Gelidium vagum]
MIIIYLILILPICFFLTQEIKRISKFLLILQKDKYILSKPISLINIDQKKVLNLAQAYINRKQWLNCIILLEKYLHDSTNSIDIIEIYKCIGFCYLSKNFYYLAENYYKQGLEKCPTDSNCLQNLKNIYSKNKLNDPIKLKDINYTISLL